MERTRSRASILLPSFSRELEKYSKIFSMLEYSLIRFSYLKKILRLRSWPSNVKLESSAGAWPSVASALLATRPAPAEHAAAASHGRRDHEVDCHVDAAGTELLVCRATACELAVEAAAAWPSACCTTGSIKLR